MENIPENLPPEEVPLKYRYANAIKNQKLEEHRRTMRLRIDSVTGPLKQHDDSQSKSVLQKIVALENSVQTQHPPSGQEVGQCLREIKHVAATHGTTLEVVTLGSTPVAALFKVNEIKVFRIASGEHFIELFNIFDDSNSHKSLTCKVCGSPNNIRAIALLLKKDDYYLGVSVKSESSASDVQNCRLEISFKRENDELTPILTIEALFCDDLEGGTFEALESPTKKQRVAEESQLTTEHCHALEPAASAAADIPSSVNAREQEPAAEFATPVGRPKRKVQEARSTAGGRSNGSCLKIISPCSLTVVYLDLANVIGFSCSGEVFALEGKDCTTVFNSKLKFAVHSGDIKCTVAQDSSRPVQWVRGGAMKGWLTKLPSSDSILARPAQRYFSLENDKLHYFHEEPSQLLEELSAAAAPSKTLTLARDTEMKVSRHKLQHCLKLCTGDQRLLIKLHERPTESEKAWMAEISRALQLARERAEGDDAPRHIWHHPSSLMKLVAAHSRGDGKNAALFCLEHSVNASGRRIAWNVAADDTTETSRYFLDCRCALARDERLEVLLCNESPFLPSKLFVMRQYGEFFLLGGSKGYLAVGVRGRTTGLLARNVVLAVNFCDTSRATKTAATSLSPLPKNALFPANDEFPHASSSFIVAIGTCAERSLYAAADSEGTISLWRLRAPKAAAATTDLSLCFKISSELLDTVKLSELPMQGKAVDGCEDIKQLSLMTVRQSLVLAVSTSKRLILVELTGLSSALTFAGFVEVDCVPNKHCDGVFALIAAAQERFVLWQVVENRTAHAHDQSVVSPSKRVEVGPRPCKISRTELSEEDLCRILHRSLKIE